MNKAHQMQQQRVKNQSTEPPGPQRTWDGPRGLDSTEEQRDFITRWRRAILRTAEVPTALKLTLPELSDYELAIYLAVKCRGGQLDESGTELDWE